ncbi:MAG TPA: UDP-3-O-acyl-N-acetylglucosamine deacetylase [Geminicoccus sp.]|jgi:UDP-3-O-[3-hydroxymyristoyl] N-acetylglucosamine deacetylase|uniref:UDP-3-O-acyl-N-acetylglucosamine deacetylase n=1 Tax=Geminicoccus sp. TaxID=2024832 RepID=UPI002E2F36C0|nr:UDP-3-O-acyl-N-acetylglucosamine deacetylase [Geminicoccus sp.]HEX2527037.1 UDP-3-O-acyl-N-acetylglucosamine deacetylase [Geminicoccus sp.]
MQRTIAHRIGCVGIGLHGGRKVSLTLLPAAPDTGIIFVRTDLPGRPVIPATADRVGDTTMCTTLVGPDDAKVATIEHLMAAFALAEIDNVTVELDGPEVPIMDGSAAPFLFLLECAGVREQDRPLRRIEVIKPVLVEAAGKFARLDPAPFASYGASIDFDHPAVGAQALSVPFEPKRLGRMLGSARTFGFAADIEQLRARGLARGGSLENAVVVGPEGILNPGGLRFPDEFVRHKLLDAIGDTFLAGAPVVGRWTGHRAGHALHVKLVRALLADRTAWRYVEDTDEDFTIEAPSAQARVKVAATA